MAIIESNLRSLKKKRAKIEKNYKQLVVFNFCTFQYVNQIEACVQTSESYKYTIDDTNNNIHQIMLKMNSTKHF